jgi:circadian clock protein KaiB
LTDVLNEIIGGVDMSVAILGDRAYWPLYLVVSCMKTAKKTYVLKLYIAGNTPNSIRALRTLNTILEEEFHGVYALKVIDVLKNPQLAEEDKILATPTLSKVLPPPVRKIIGDLSDRERVLVGLDLLYEELSDNRFTLPE